jgi:predicted Zn-dependent protease
MAVGDFRLCPACGARNKGKWEFCVRCGESLQDVTMVSASGVSAKAEPETPPEARWASPWGAGLLALVMVGIVIATAWSFHGSAPSAPRDAGVLTLPTVPVARPAPSPLPAQRPGAQYYTEGEALLAKGDIPGAVRLLGQALGADPSNPLYENAYGEALWVSGARADALAHLEAAVRLSPNASGYRVDLAVALNGAGRTDDAISEFRSALSRDPDNMLALKDLGGILVRQGSFDEAASLLSQAAEHTPSDPVLQQDLGYALEKTRDIPKAVEAYHKVLELSPDAAVSRGRLADILFTQGKTAEAIEVIQGGIERDPSLPGLRRDLGSLLERSGRIAEAVSEYREYARLAPNAADAKALADRADRLEKRAAAGPS